MTDLAFCILYTLIVLFINYEYRYIEFHSRFFGVASWMVRELACAFFAASDTTHASSRNSMWSEDSRILGTASSLVRPEHNAVRELFLTSWISLYTRFGTWSEIFGKNFPYKNFFYIFLTSVRHFRFGESNYLFTHKCINCFPFCMELIYAFNYS